jgi:hypothetical protein
MVTRPLVRFFTLSATRRATMWVGSVGARTWPHLMVMGWVGRCSGWDAGAGAPVGPHAAARTAAAPAPRNCRRVRPAMEILLLPL